MLLQLHDLPLLLQHRQLHQLCPMLLISRLHLLFCVQPIVSLYSDAPTESVVYPCEKPTST